ncbi:drug/metabolite transporter (DMT)-like permease [Croceifilum oryzae]|uniref:Drug/metabolite transporter (DMT)-like permease n=2 Tax=Croceifilum oryzae TaxID=1553429 RepID=A0AAJ1TGA0_9BACL|nr:drug/metabolite transporter (DMT)-like permease [Croceifilum oryzae]
MMKVSSAKKGSHTTLLFGLYVTGTLGFLGYLLITGEWDTSPIVWIAGLIIGFGSIAGNILFMKALDRGPASLTSPIINSNILFIVVMSVLFYNERLSLIESIGVGLLVLAIFIIPIDPNENLRIRNKTWYLYVFTAMVLFFLRTGGLKITEELDRSNSMILFISYLMGVIWFAIDSFCKRGNLGSTQAIKVGWIWGLSSGIFSFAGMQAYTLALRDGPASIVSPIFATNSLVVALLSILVYKERLSPFQKLALVLLAVGLVTIRL